MRFHSEQTEQYINALAAAISKDPASLEDWRCLVIRPKHPEVVRMGALQKIREMHKDVDCDMVVCKDFDILLISRDLTADDLYDLAEAISDELPGAEPSFTLYDVFRDWRAIRVLLCTKADGVYKPVELSESIENLGEVDSLKAVFAETKSIRKARQPQFVMIVEDDLLTRRLVANSFKENYALVTAHNAQEAILHYLMHAPDIVFLDIGLPDANGFAVLKKIIAFDPDAYVVMFSSNSYLDNVTKALAAGASGFIAKPFKREKMRHYIEDAAVHHHKA